jgi:putative flippase GtrA
VPTSKLESSQQAPGLLMRVLRTQSVAFTLVGAINTLVGFLLFVVWISILGDHLYYVAVALAYSISVVIAFVLHRTLVFRVRGRVMRDFVGFVFVNSGGLVLNLIGMALAVGVLRFAPVPSQAVVLGLVAVASYFGHRHISFQRKPVAPDRGR